MSSDPTTYFDFAKLALPAIAFTAGVTAKVAAWTVKRELNGSAQKIKEIHADVKSGSNDRQEIKDAVHKIDNRLVRVETKLDLTR